MTEDIDRELVQRVRQLRNETGEGPIENHPGMAKVFTTLDRIWWTRVERLVTDAAQSSPDRLLFTKEDRLLLDAGVLDFDLIDLGEQIRPTLLRELYAEGEENHSYFSQWLEGHYRSFLLYGRMGETNVEPEESESGKKQETRVIRQTRHKIYSRLAPLFRNLPGFPPKAVEMLIQGRIDQILESITAKLSKGQDPRLAEQRNQLAQIRSRMIVIARSRAKSDVELALFDSLAKIDRSARDRNLNLESDSLRPHLDIRERSRYLMGELRLVRSLLKLGVAGAGILRTHSVLLTTRQRICKADLPPTIRLVEDCDPYLPGPPRILVAPYVGTGFYEWDRDTIFVPLVAMCPVEEAIVTALANYRLLLDGLQEGGGLRRAYENEFRSDNFREEFTRDYRDWVLGVGKGYRGAMEPARYDFFLRRIGPSVDSLYAPADLVRLTPDERRIMIREIREKINRAEATWKDHYRIAVCYYRENRGTDAISELTRATRMNPIDGRLLCAMGYLTSQHSTVERSRRYYEEAIALNPNTLWHVLASAGLDKL